MPELPFPHVDGVTHRYVDAAGLRVHLAEAGPPDGEPVLLLHGWPQHWYEWRKVGPALAEAGYRVLMPDLRGLGWTEVTKKGYEKENLARDQIALLDALGIDRVKLIGHDWGAYSGFLLCLFAPERIDRYVATNMAHPWPRPTLRGFLNSWRFAYQLPMILPFIGPRVTRKRGFIKFMLRRASPSAFTEADLEAFEAAYRDPDRAFATSRYYRRFQTHDLPLLVRGHWRAYRLRTPTLVLYGTGDLVVRPYMLRGYEPYADDMRVETVEGTGHFIIDGAPDIVAARALEFFG
jgi:pimeloyl-ACP methyl ester carboxylesterase